jgi:hypothetical protein
MAMLVCIAFTGGKSYKMRFRDIKHRISAFPTYLVEVGEGRNFI